MFCPCFSPVKPQATPRSAWPSGRFYGVSGSKQGRQDIPFYFQILPEEPFAYRVLPPETAEKSLRNQRFPAIFCVSSGGRVTHEEVAPGGTFAETLAESLSSRGAQMGPGPPSLTPIGRPNPKKRGIPNTAHRFSSALPATTPAVRKRLTPQERHLSGAGPGIRRVPSAPVHGQNTDSLLSFAPSEHPPDPRLAVRDGAQQL